MTNVVVILLSVSDALPSLDRSVPSMGGLKATESSLVKLLKGLSPGLILRAPGRCLFHSGWATSHIDSRDQYGTGLLSPATLSLCTAMRHLTYVSWLSVRYYDLVQSLYTEIAVFNSPFCSPKGTYLILKKKLKTQINTVELKGERNTYEKIDFIIFERCM